MELEGFLIVYLALGEERREMGEEEEDTFHMMEGEGGMLNIYLVILIMCTKALQCN